MVPIGKFLHTVAKIRSICFDESMATTELIEYIYVQ
jgi:hypothetical protein